MKFEITVSVEGVTCDEADQLYERCHALVSALICACKYQRPEDEVDAIGTNIESRVLEP